MTIVTDSSGCDDSSDTWCLVLVEMVVMIVTVLNSAFLVLSLL